MTVKITAKDVLLDILMLAAAVLIVIQRDETGYPLFLDFKGLLGAIIILILVPLHHVMLVAHGLLQDALDYFE